MSENKMSEIKNKILSDALNSKVEPVDEQKIRYELDELENTAGRSGENNLENFYNIYKEFKSSDQSPGKENKVNSYLAYILGMTTKRPDIDGELLPKRRYFARASFPDIDSDFDYEYRDQIYDYIIDKYGREKVGNIGTYTSLKLKNYLQRAYKAIDPDGLFSPDKEGKERWKKNAAVTAQDISNAIGKQKGAFIRATDENGEEVHINSVHDGIKYVPEFRSYMEKYPEIVRYADDICGLLCTPGVHPAGIVISDCDLQYIAPLRMTKKKSELAGEVQNSYSTQYAYEDLEFIGLIKFDLLALSTLSVIARTLNLIKENYGIEIDIENLPLDDKKTFALYRSGYLDGVFQCESPGMQKTMEEINVDRFADIVAGVALYRPGPMEFIKDYAERKKGIQEVDYFHSSIEPYVKPYLEETYGILCYQEQLMQICNSLAGFSITDGYVMIKAVGKKKSDLLHKYRTQFISGCQSNGINSNIAERYWDQKITPFANYGFNKSHAAAYGYLSYSCAYLKANYTEEFMVSQMNVLLSTHKHDKYERIYSFERESERMGMKILPKSINNCGWDYKVEKKKDPSFGVYHSEIRPSIRCKGMSSNAAREIIKNAPYKSMKDLVYKAEMKMLDSKSIEALCEAGFFKDKSGKKMNKDVVIEKFKLLQRDRKKLQSKGLVDDNLFG